jgi:hypothetical protein
MNEDEAAKLANQVIGAILEHQPRPFAWDPLDNEDTAKRAAKAIASFRQELIDALKNQP